jgi:hypothetical protein
MRLGSTSLPRQNSFGKNPLAVNNKIIAFHKVHFPSRWLELEAEGKNNPTGIRDATENHKTMECCLEALNLFNSSLKKTFHPISFLSIFLKLQANPYQYQYRVLIPASIMKPISILSTTLIFMTPALECLNTTAKLPTTPFLA